MNQEKFDDKDNVSYDYNVAKEVTNVNQISPFTADTVLKFRKILMLNMKYGRQKHHC